MRHFNKSLLGLCASTLVLASCASTGPQPPAKGGVMNPEAELAYFRALATSMPSSAAAGAEEFSALVDAFEVILGEDTVSYSSISSDGTVLEDVSIKFAMFGDLTMEMEELRAWGVNEGAASALSTKSGDVLIADRLDVRGITYTGVESFINEFMTGYMNGLMGEISIDADIEAEDGEVEELELDLDFVDQEYIPEFQKYDLYTQRSVIDGLTVHASSLAYEPTADGVIGIAQGLAAITMSTSYDAAVTEGVDMKLAMSQMGSTTEMVMKQAFAGSRGWSKGDLAFSVSEDLVMDSDVSLPEGATEEEAAVAEMMGMFGMASGATYDVYAVEGLKFSKILDYVLKAELPPVTDTDLLSFGRWRIKGESQSIGGDVFYTVDDQYMDFSQFHWFVPTLIDAKAKGVVYDVEVLADKIGPMLSMMEGDLDPSAEKQAHHEELVAGVVEVMKEYGLIDLPMDAAFKYKWNPESGDGKLTMVMDTDGIFRTDFGLGFQIADFDTLADFMPGEGEEFDAQGFQATFAQSAALADFELEIDDDGGIYKMFGLMTGIAKLIPAEEAEGPVLMLQNADAAGLQMMASTTMRMAAGQAGAQFPPAEEYLISIADFILNGGSLRFAAEPAELVTQQSVMEATMAPGFTPEDIIDLLGFTVTHTAPETSEE